MCVPGCQEAVRSALSRRGLFRGAAAAGVAATGFAAVAVAPEAMAAPAAAPMHRFSTAVDLTHTMSPDFPTFFGEPGIALEKKSDFKKDGYNLNWWRVIEHAGTHIDAPLHFSANGPSVEAIAPEALVVPLAVVDVSGKARQSPDYLMARDDLAAWETAHGRLPDGCCVAMRTGWDKLVNDARFTGRDIGGTYHFPGVDPEAAQWLIAERHVAGLAVDTLSLDNGPSKDFKTHYLWLPSGRWGLENVANLDQVPAAGATLVVGAPKVKGATGGLTRLFALV
jgi:kynurenine formamidase